MDLSTAHLPERFFNSEVEGEAGNIRSYIWGTPVQPLEHGALLWIPDDPKASAEAGTDGETTAPEVLAIQLFARGLGCDYVLFDADAEETDELPRWDWGSTPPRLRRRP